MSAAETESVFSRRFPKQMKEVVNDFVDDLIFETIIDYFRKNEGFPAAKPLQDILNTNEVRLQQEISLKREEIGNKVICPYCQEEIESNVYPTHLFNHKKGEKSSLLKKVKELF